MHWFFIALIAPTIWGTCNHIDKHIVTRYFTGTTQGTPLIVTGVMGLLTAIGIATFHFSSLSVSIGTAALVLLNGALFIFGLVPYYHALKYDEASRVVPLFQFVSVFLYFLGLIFLHEHLSLQEIIAALLIILGAFTLTAELSKGGFRIKKQTVLLMALASLMLAVNTLVFKLFATSSLGFWTTNFWMGLGMFGGSLSLFLAVRPYREKMVDTVLSKNWAALAFVGFNEGMSVIARLFFYFATTLAPVALVQTVNSFQSLVVFVTGIFITLFVPRFEPESLLRRHLVQKLVSISVIIGGTYLLLRP